MPFFWHTLLKISLSYVLLLTTSLSYANPKTPLSPLVSAETALKDIVWESHDSSAEFGDPRAQKGGTFHSYLYSFPTTFRTFGLNTHHSANQNGAGPLYPFTMKHCSGIVKNNRVESGERKNIIKGVNKFMRH